MKTKLKRKSDFSILEKVNCLLGEASSFSVDYRQQVLTSLAFFRNKNIFEDLDEPFRLEETLEGLARLYFKDDENTAIVAWDVSNEYYEPLWFCHELTSRLKEVSGFPEVVLIIPNFKQCICPSNCYWTKNTQYRYDVAVQGIESLCLHWKTENTKMNLIIV
tara:strand:- start:15 stop:500 length:486 start_codon:yes stop_codon:yes gene_type:complete